MKQTYLFLNDVKTNMNLYEKEDLTDIEIKKINNFMRRKCKKGRSKKTFKSVACAAIAVLLVANTAFAGEIHDAAKNVQWRIGNFLGIDKELQDYVTVLNTSQTDKGFTITLNEVILDEKELIVSSTIKSKEPIDSDNSLMTFAVVYVNGRNVSASAGGGGRMIDDYTMESVTDYKLKNVDTDGKLDFEINYNQIGVEENAVRGNWNFDFTTNGEALSIDTKRIPMDVTYELPNGVNIKLTEYTSNNLGDKIYFKIPEISRNKGAEYDMQLEGKDDLGNKVDFYLSHINGEEGNGCFKIDGTLNEKAKNIILKPYAVKFPETSGRLSHDFKSVGEEFTIDLDNTENKKR